MQTGKSISISKALATTPLPSTKRTPEEALRMEKWANKVMAEYGKNHFSPVKVSEADYDAAQKDLDVLSKKVYKNGILKRFSEILTILTGTSGMVATMMGQHLVDFSHQGLIELSTETAGLVLPAGIALLGACSCFLVNAIVRETPATKKFALTLQDIASKQLHQTLEPEQARSYIAQIERHPQEELFVVGRYEATPTISVESKNDREYFVQQEAEQKELGIFTPPLQLTSSNPTSDPYLAGVNEKLATILSLTLTVEEQALVERVKAEALETSQLYQEMLKIQSNKSSKTAEALMESNLSLLEGELDALLEEKAKGVEERMRVQANYLQSRRAPESRLSLDNRREIASQAGV